jgi:hypothetical protein
MRTGPALLFCLFLALTACTPSEGVRTPDAPAAAGRAPAAPAVSDAAAAENLGGFLAAQGYRMIPLRRLATGHFAIDGTAGTTSLILIVDTGASHTILDQQRAARFRLVLRQERSRAAGLGVADQQVSSAVLRDVIVGPLQLDSLPVSVLDLSHVNEALRQLRVPPVDGIMGADMLLRKQAIIDYGTTRLYIRGD